MLFYLGLCILIAILFYKTYDFWQYLQIRLWFKQLNLSQHSRHFHSLFSEINGFQLSKQARIHYDAFEFVYGEIDFVSFIALLSLVKPDSETIFYDLGSGVGKPAIACAMVFPIKKSCGIEIFEELHHEASQIKIELENNALYTEQAKKIKFIQGDFLKDSFEEATLIFINATGFFGSNWDLINQHLNHATNCKTVISISKPLSSLHFRMIRQTKIRMSWGITRAYIHQPMHLGTLKKDAR